MEYTETHTISTLIPNWNHFCNKYHPHEDFIDAFISRVTTLDDTTLQEALLKRINIELGILLLHDTEIDAETYALLLKSITNTDI